MSIFQMRFVKNTSFVMDVMMSIPSFIWIEDLYLLLVGNGHRLCAKTVYKIVQHHVSSGLLQIKKIGRRTMVGLRAE